MSFVGPLKQAAPAARTLERNSDRMQCEVLLFAQLADAVGEARLTIDLPDQSTVADGLHKLAEAHEPIAKMIAHIAVAVDEQYAARETVLRNGQTIALIPPVSGG